MKKPLIGITLDNENPGNYSNFPWYAIRANYLSSIYKFKAIPFPLFHENKAVKSIVKLIDGLIITGGNFDINPKLYGKKNKGSRNLKLKRTSFEIAIFKEFLKSSKPILGICGGEQLMNIALGGSLVQDIKKNKINLINHEQENPRNETSHKINIIKNTKLSKIINKDKIMVNSAHHQSVKRLGKELIKSAVAEDGIIEAIEHKKHNWCIGVQWHPEFLITSYDSNIINNFINAA